MCSTPTNVFIKFYGNFSNSWLDISVWNKWWSYIPNYQCCYKVMDNKRNSNSLLNNVPLLFVIMCYQMKAHGSNSSQKCTIKHFSLWKVYAITYWKWYWTHSCSDRTKINVRFFVVFHMESKAKEAPRHFSKHWKGKHIFAFATRKVKHQPNYQIKSESVELKKRRNKSYALLWSDVFWRYLPSKMLIYPLQCRLPLPPFKMWLFSDGQGNFDPLRLLWSKTPSNRSST